MTAVCVGEPGDKEGGRLVGPAGGVGRRTSVGVDRAHSGPRVPPCGVPAWRLGGWTSWVSPGARAQGRFCRGLCGHRAGRSCGPGLGRLLTQGPGPL